MGRLTHLVDKDGWFDYGHSQILKRAKYLVASITKGGNLREHMICRELSLAKKATWFSKGLYVFQLDLQQRDRQPMDSVAVRP